MMHHLLFLLLLVPLFVVGQVEPDSSRLDSLRVPLINLSADDLEDDAQNQDISGLLQSSRDVFTSIAGYNFSAARYRIRGYQSDQYTIMMNGVEMNNPEMGWGIWSFWGGLNDVTRYPETKNGISTSDFSFGSVGGYTNIDTRASRYRKGTRVSYALSNRTYMHRVMATHSTGMQANGWAFTVSGSWRHSNEGYVDGSFFRGYSYFLSAEKKLNAKHSLNFTGFAAPTIQGRSGIAVQEAYDLTGTNFYNPYWGYQTSEKTGERVKRNARERNNHQPSVFLTHYWEMNKRKKLQTTIYSSFGRSGNTNLNWYDAKDPRPDYYRYFPSYYTQDNPSMAAQLTEAWGSDPSVSQINWDALYNANYKNLYTLKNVDGIEGNNVEFLRSKYIVEEYRSDPFQLGLSSFFNTITDGGLKITSGINVDRYVSHNFKQLVDLLGGEYWVDVDQFAEQQISDPEAAQNNLEEPNKLIGEGDDFGYNYDVHVNTQQAFGQIEQSTKRIDWFAGLSLSSTQFFRYGNWINGRFPDNSGGKSAVNTFFNYGVKAGGVFKLTGRHFITANGLYQTRAPYSRDAYLSPRTRHSTVNNLENVETISFDLNYQIRYPGFKARASVFYTEINNQLWTRSFYHDEYRNFVNYSMSGMDQTFSGLEVGMEKNFTDAWQVTAAFTTGQFLYSNRPKATISVDNTEELVAEDKTIYLENYRIGGMPQTAASIGIKYNSPKYWFVGLSFNYYTNIYLDPNPDRRTAEAVAGYVETDPQWDEMLDQVVIHDLEHNKFFENNYTLDGFAGISFKIKGHYLRANVSVNNILNNKKFKTGGFEQLRYDTADIGKFPPRYGYMYGTTFFGMLTFLF